MSAMSPHADSNALRQMAAAFAGCMADEYG
jgi:hypothetical protein